MHKLVYPHVSSLYVLLESFLIPDQLEDLPLESFSLIKKVNDSFSRGLHGVFERVNAVLGSGLDSVKLMQVTDLLSESFLSFLWAFSLTH